MIRNLRTLADFTKWRQETGISAGFVRVPNETLTTVIDLLERAQGILSSLILHDGVDEEEANKLWDEINAVIPSEEVKF